ncbi:MAG TPA: ATP-dependent Clp protease adaptor ClpS [Kutzneria sp.]|jgi:ATP-dependent Clp protease adapter protein ClpS|nr:ATP-dependent Clp protease adaptor ClpS [Kutzneria sp.]
MSVYRVVVFNDDLNTMVLVTDVINRACGVPLPEAAAMMRRIHTEGCSTVGLLPTRDDAESMAARLLGFGLRVKVEANR